MAIAGRAKRKHTVLWLLYGMRLIGIEISNYCRKYVINTKGFCATQMIKKKNRPVSVDKETPKFCVFMTVHLDIIV